jgi:translation initiation factor 3 subunit C
MHINLQLLDCIYMISAMLLEIPNIAENQFLVNKKVISKNFKKLIETYDLKAFQLAPENYRDNIVYAAKQLNKSNWKQALEHIFAIKMINKMHEFHNEQFRSTLILRVKEAALKAFLCRSARSYESFGVQSLCDLFALTKPQLLQIVNRLIIKGKLQAHMDLSSQFIVMDTERIQSNEAKELQ